ncbi:MAG TPA: alpha/beta hydrolase [Hypericibacter adhaerens]|uniref:alpha/beta fold hydrolase n=1 Tax=Hypericibacter adhaerens TaxID=2602016 RepID=UPI002B85B01E|nr:alpha/beta hydrolase [Hypericibacter adhaerens]HWA44160.1 alpha/beta hydrolase [Hypericibacter adhaerens]
MLIKERDVEFEGTTMHCYEGGKGYPVLMIHGSGPGTASATNWAHVMEPLSKSYRILAMDMIGYGKSGRKPAKPYFDMDMWVRQAIAALDLLAPRGPVGIIGHSLGGAVALRTALEVPRVNKLILQGSLGAQKKITLPIARSWRVPKDEKAFRHYYKNVIRVRIPLTDEFVKGRMALLRKDGYDKYFNTMFVGNKQRYVDASRISPQALRKLKCDVTMIHGADDACVPFEEGGIELARLLPRADLYRLADCGHPCSFEQPQKFIALAKLALG